jgi:hypothetical protein
MSVRKRTLAVAAAVGLLAVAVVAGPANAGGSGQTLAVGDFRCTDYTQSDNGITANIYVISGTGDWTVRRSTSVGGAETVVARGSAGSITVPQFPSQKVIPATVPGTFLYRMCLTITKSATPGFFPLAYYEISLASTSPNAVTNIGPETANLSQYARACGDHTPVRPGQRVRLVGSGSVETHWLISVTGTTNNYEGPWYAFLGDGFSIDQVVELDPEITNVTACASYAKINPNRLSVSLALSVVG